MFKTFDLYTIVFEKSVVGVEGSVVFAIFIKNLVQGLKAQRLINIRMTVNAHLL